MIDLLRKQLDALDAQVAIHGALIASMRHTLNAAAVADAPRVESGPCAAVDEQRCAKRSEEGGVQMMGGVVVCVGCQQRLTAQSPT